MGRHFQSLLTWYDGRPGRERIALLVCAVIVLVFLFNVLIFEPSSQQRRKALHEATQLQVEIANLQVRSAEIEARRANHPDTENRQRAALLTEEVTRLNEQLQTNIVTLVSPREMPEFLKDLLTRQKKLELVALENLPPEKLDLGHPVKDDQDYPVLYRHRLNLEFSGDYLTLLKYLQQLEKLPRSLVWEEVDVENDNYPRAKVRLQVYTLSLTEGWIGG